MLMGMSQEKLGKAVSLTFQQIQKYERGSNRIGSSRLYQFSKVLNVPISFFFDDMPEAGEAQSPGLAESGAAYSDASMTKRETLELVRAYYKIKNPAIRKRIFELVKAIGRSNAEA
jgi:transcriptional regulator with XRE-family HTH domain